MKKRFLSLILIFVIILSIFEPIILAIEELKETDTVILESEKEEQDELLKIDIENKNNNELVGDSFESSNEDFEYIIQNGNTTIKKYKKNLNTGEVTVPSSIQGCPVTTIGEGAFSNCWCKSVSLPYSLIIIGNSAFSNCKNLQQINIPINLTKIGDSAFFNCKKLNNIQIPNSVTTIERAAFGRL